MYKEAILIAQRLDDFKKYYGQQKTIELAGSSNSNQDKVQSAVNRHRSSKRPERAC